MLLRTEKRHVGAEIMRLAIGGARPGNLEGRQDCPTTVATVGSWNGETVPLPFFASHRVRIAWRTGLRGATGALASEVSGRRSQPRWAAHRRGSEGLPEKSPIGGEERSTRSPTRHPPRVQSRSWLGRQALPGTRAMLPNSRRDQGSLRQETRSRKRSGDFIPETDQRSSARRGDWPQLYGPATRPFPSSVARLGSNSPCISTPAAE